MQKRIDYKSQLCFNGHKKFNFRIHHTQCTNIYLHCKCTCFTCLIFTYKPGVEKHLVCVPESSFSFQRRSYTELPINVKPEYAKHT